MDVRQTIAELTSQLSEINYDSDEENIQGLIKGSHQHEDSISDEVSQIKDVQPSTLRRNAHSLSLPGNIYGGKTTSRNRHSSLSETGSDSDTSITNKSEGDESFSDASNGKIEDNSEGSGEAVSGDEYASSEDETSKTTSSKQETFDPSEFKTDIYSAGSKNVTSDIKKGVAIKNQIRIWENLLEFRIKLQKGLVASNNLPPGEELLDARVSLNEENQTKVNKCNKDLLVLLGKLLDIQDLLLKQTNEFKKTKSWSSADMDEEIKSDTSEFEEEENDKDQIEPKKKRRKLNDFSSAIKEHYDLFTPFRNASIQKWNDKTKVSTGKMASSNFSAFDQSTLKQIEQTMADKSRLINRTRIRRHGNMNSGSSKNQLGSEKDNQELLDPEVFDDTDFYHKLLRDYIERKSVDVAGSSQTERQMIELQKLRSKMKKNVDTRSTKGRKLRYVALPKLINFMAPHPYHSWSDQAEKELYNSLFGKIKVIS